MIRSCFFSVLCMCTLFLNYASTQEPDLQIRINELRNAQKTASYNEYYRYEAEIDTLKRKQNNDQGSRITQNWQFVVAIFHFFPLLVWQLCALILALLYMIIPRRRFVSLFFLLVTCSVIGIGQYEYSFDWLMVQKQMPVHLGPSFMYPERGRLEPLDEVVILNRSESWLKIARNDLVGWVFYD